MWQRRLLRVSCCWQSLPLDPRTTTIIASQTTGITTTRQLFATASPRLMMAAQLEPLPEVSRVSPRCIRILGGNPGKFTLQGTNTYLLGTGARRLLVDTGEGMPSWATALQTTLRAEQATVDAVLITHWHPDHSGGIDQVLQLIAADVPVYQRQYSTSSTDVVRDIRDDQTFAVEGATLRAVHTPGHASNHMVFVLEEEGALLAGDNVLGQGTAVFEDLTVYLQSLRLMRALYDTGAKGGCRLYPAHGPVIKDGPAKIAEYLAHRQKREDKVVQLLRGCSGPLTSMSAPTPQTVMQLVEVIYADVRKDLHEAAARGVLQILQKLAAEGTVVHEGPDGLNGTWRWQDRSTL